MWVGESEKVGALHDERRANLCRKRTLRLKLEALVRLSCACARIHDLTSAAFGVPSRRGAVDVFKPMCCVGVWDENLRIFHSRTKTALTTKCCCVFENFHL